MRNPTISGSVLITGGTGSFGQAYTRLLLDLPEESRPPKIVIYSRGEHAQEEMERTFVEHKDRLRFFIGDVRDRDRLQMAMTGIECVVHAAALKVVPKCEIDPSEAVKTNVGGADNVIHAAIKADVWKVVALSTDKAVAPVNLYGATKLTAEKLFLAGKAYAGTYGPRFAVVRYGNVSGSKGSVIPLWQAALRDGKMLTITHSEATRFWLRLDDACRLVQRVLVEMVGGELYVPHMRAYRVGELAHAVTQAVRRGPEYALPMVGVIGMRPGEKMHETIISADEMHRFARWPSYFIGNGQARGEPLSAAVTSDTAPRIPMEQLIKMVEAL